MRLLLIEDQNELAQLTMRAMRAGGFAVDIARCLTDASEAVAVAAYDIVLVDRKLPDGDGLDWLRAQRRRGLTSPALMLTATKSDVTDRVEGLEGGADDYVLKPVDMSELLARVRVLLRRPQSLTQSVIDVGNLSFNATGREAFVDGRRLSLPRREIGLLEHLVRRAGRVVPRAALEESLYSYDEEVSSNAIEVSVHRLRSCLAEAEASVRVLTVRGVGYMLKDGEAPAPRRSPAVLVAEGAQG